MEAFDAATMFSISTVLLVLSAVDVYADIPDGVVYTDVRKVVAEGNDAVLKCQFRGTPLAVYWKKGSDPESAPNLITGVEGLPSTGSCVKDGTCEMADDFSLIIKEVGMEDQGRYICRVANHIGILIYNFTDFKVIARDELRIYTKPRVMGLAGFGVILPCIFRPTVEAQKVLWKRVYGDGGSTDEIIFEYTSDGNEAPASRRYVWCEKYGLIIDDIQVSDEGNFTCLVTTIDGIEIKNSTVLVVKAYKSAINNATFVLAIVDTVLLIMLCMDIPFIKNCFRRVFRCNRPDRSNAHIVPQADIEQQQLMEPERKLDNLRKYLKKYRPGKATDMRNTKRFPRVISLGVFGVMGVGKSSLINSLSFALNSAFENVVSGVIDGGEVGDRIRLTKHITILDNRGLRDLSEWQIKDSPIPRIRGERGVNPDNGVVTHCPIFVHDIRKTFPPVCIFLKQFTSAVREQYGQNVVVVFTHMDTVDSLDDYIKCTHTFTGIPKEYIWSFENYTENNITEDVEKSIQYLEFLQKCLEVGERNMRGITENHGNQV